jgi:hypothetical protein
MSPEESDSVKQVLVNPAEYSKFVYLIQVMDALDRSDERADEDIYFFKSTQGIKAERRFDWNHVARHCAPQLLISFLRGAERFEEERSFREHPRSVIVPRTADVVQLDEVFELVLESESTDNSAVDSVALFSQLRSLAQSRKGRTAMDVEPLIRKLERALTSK